MKNSAQRLYLLFIYAFLYIPIAVVILFSFNNSDYSLLWKGGTLRWYHHLFHDHALANVAMHSLVLATSAATLASMLGLVAAVSLYRYRFFGKRILDLLLLTLIMTPDIVVGSALLILFSTTHFPLGFWSLLLAHTSFCVPFCVVTITAALSGLNRNVLEAARDLGAKEYQIFFRIITPLLLPSLAASWLLSFTLSIDDVVISYFVSGPGYQILPLKIYSMIKVGVDPEINALCTIMVAITALLVILAQSFVLKKKR